MGTVVSHVYVHAPFCARRCSYCDFAVSVRRTGDAPAWTEALTLELAAVTAEGLLSLAPALRTLYVGGGTPSLLGPAAMAGLATVVGPHRLTEPGLEWTAEANPESLDGAVARAWVAAGVNRISLGAQSFDERVLRWMGRLHGPEGTWQAVRTARAAGLTNLSVDLIFGLPTHLARDWRADLERVLALDVPHVSLYGLTVEAGTPLGRAVAEGRVEPVDEERYRDEFYAASEVLGSAGYEHYEVSNFARPGARSAHNSAYWTGAPYLGLGNGAHSYAHPVRRWNVRDWEDYRARLHAGSAAEAERENVGDAAAQLERLWLGLRAVEGVSIEGTQNSARRLVLGWERAGLAMLDGDTVRLTPEGWLVLDRLAVDLDAAWHRA